MTNIFAVLFQVAAALLVLLAALRERLHAGWMIAAGVALGLAVSTRWTSLWAAAFLGLVLLAMRGRRFFTLRELALAVLAFAVLPVSIYVLSYVPWMRQGHALSDLWPHQKAIWRYHADLRATHPYFSKWYTWPWLYRPTWYYFKQDTSYCAGIVAIGNPAIWWVSVPRRRGRSSPGCGAGTRGGCSRARGSSRCTCRGASRRARSTTATTSSRPYPTPAWLSASSSTRAWDGPAAGCRRGPTCSSWS
jgi:4-amino-4-deoxy-L-arabinose transferase-like glycosyltransferase